MANNLLAQLGSMTMMGLASTNYFVPSNTKPATEKTVTSPGPAKVGSYTQSKWLYDTDLLEVRVAALYDLETEVETIQEQIYELLTSFTIHWLIRGVVTGLLTFEFMDLGYLRLQADWKLFQVDPFSFEVQEPDWLGGSY